MKEILLDEIILEAEELKDDIKKLIDEKHGNKKVLSVFLALQGMAASVWSYLEFKSTNQIEREFAKDIMDNTLEYIIKKRGENLNKSR
jgi:predicted transcriptional regulator